MPSVGQSIPHVDGRDKVTGATPYTVHFELPGMVHAKILRSALPHGRVTRVEVTPPIKDAAYRRQFNERMMGYLFTPAATRDGRRVDYVASVTVIP